MVLANLLGNSGLRIAVIEKDKDVYPVPRATHLDEETLRNFQLTGLMPLLKVHTCPFGSMEVADENGNVLMREELIQPGAEHGYKGSRFFDQPAFEKILRNGLKRFPSVNFFAGYEALNIQQDENSVSVSIKDSATGEDKTLSGKYAVGCDGGRSMVRSVLNIEMDAHEPAREWIIADSVLKNPEDASLLPDRFRYVLKKERLTIFAYGIGNNNRWEFQLKKGEAEPHESLVRFWISKYIPLDKLEITRIAKYAHNSLVARKWKAGRIFLAGDAAHMMPPSAGQGLCSGVRDAVNLAWKLETVIKDGASVTLFDTYEQERRQHLFEILKRTLFIGKQLEAKNAFESLLRKIRLRLIQNLPGLKDYLRKTFNSPYQFKSGFINTSSSLAGSQFPQTNSLSDNLIGYRFALITNAALTEEQMKRLSQKGLMVIDREPLFVHWLKENDVDFALVRPDKVIYAAGKLEYLTQHLNSVWL